MTFIDAPNNFFIGRVYDPNTDEVLDDTPVYYDSRDLTTHGLVLGMTGSGKTGLCVCLLEEAILDGIPVLIIDPKGDMGNLLLTFSDFDPKAFEPWIDEDEARRKEKDVPTMAQDKASLWQNGLGGWGIDSARMEKLKNAAEYTIFTPGSDAGVPISILASLKAPKGDFEANEESLREQINGMVTALLSLAGVQAEPVKDAEHVLLANIFEHNWRASNDLTIEDVIMQIQEPPFEKLGVFPIDKYIPADKRMSLAMTLNNVIASPSFEAWLEGAPMDMQQLLYTPDGKPRVAVFYTSHLNDTERMFVMTLVLETLLGWMRNLKGTSSLRALLYIDEIFGYFPPIQNPPSKEPLLRLLKQARAFGIGVLMATQNPVDLDYKGLSNIGTWMIGRLQSDGDRDRIMAGLKEAAASGDMDLAAVKQLVAQVKSRVFLMRNVHDKGATTLFHSRWAMNYLAGPLTRQQIGTLMERRSAEASQATSTESASPTSTPLPTTSESTEPETELPRGFTVSKPAVSDVDEYFLPINVKPAEAVRLWERDYNKRVDDPEKVQLAYEPMLFAQVSVRYDDRKSGIRKDCEYAFHVARLESSGYVDWESVKVPAVDRRDVETETRKEAWFGELPVALSDDKRIKELEKNLVDVLYKDYALTVPCNPQFDVYGDPDAEPSEFEAAVSQAAREKRDAEVDKVTEQYTKKIEKLEDRREKKERELAKDEAEASASGHQQVASIAEGVLNFLSGRRTSSSLSKIGRASSKKSSLKAEVRETKAELESLEREIADMEQELRDALDEVEQKWQDAQKETEDYEINPYKKDIQVMMMGVGWVPVWTFTSDERYEFVNAFAVNEG